MSSGAGDEKPTPPTAFKVHLDDLFGDKEEGAAEEDPFAQVGTAEVEEGNQQDVVEQSDTPSPDAPTAQVDVSGISTKEDSTDVFHTLDNQANEDGDGLARAVDLQHDEVAASVDTPTVAPGDTSGDLPTSDSPQEPSVGGSEPPSAAQDFPLDAEPTTPTNAAPTSPIRLPEAEADDPFASLGNEDPQVDTAAPVQSASSPIRLGDADGDEPFGHFGTEDQHDFPVGQDEEDFPIGQDEQEKDYSALLAEFSGGLEEDMEPTPDVAESSTNPVTLGQARQAGDLFGEEPGSTPFDELLPSAETDFLPTSSSSTTPPPDLSIEKSFQHSEAYGYDDTVGDSSMQTDSNWLEHATMDDGAFDIQAESGSDPAPQPVSAVTDDGSSPLGFEVPHGWYDGDTFHYYTEEEREQVRLTMLGQAGWPSDEPAVAQESGRASTASPALQPAFSENAARRTPNPDQYAEPYAPSSSRPSATSSGSFYGSQYTPATASTDPYAPSSSASTASPYAPPSEGQTSSNFASPMQLADPYAPAPAAWDPYPDPQGSAQSRRGQTKPSPLASSAPRMASSAKPPPPQRVASTAYDPPFLRPQKSFARPISAAPLASGTYGQPDTPPLPVAPTPPAAPPSGPPRRSATPNIAPPPVVESRKEAYTERSTDYSPSLAAPADTPSAAPPRGPSRAPSTQPPRQPQRAPSYNSFDPPLRPQPTSRPPSRAPQMAAPLETPPNPSLLSPPTGIASAFPERPGSRGSSGRGPPSFGQPPPPSGPPRRATPSFQPPPRPPSTASLVAPPPRPPSVTQAPAWSPPIDQGEQETLASPLEVSTYAAIPQLHSGQEEPDEEGGPASWSADEDGDINLPTREPDQQSATDDHRYMPSNGVTAPYSHQTPQSEQPVQSVPDWPPSIQTRGSAYDAYAPATSRSPIKSPRESYHPYRRTSTTSPLKSRKESYDPYGTGNQDTQQTHQPPSSGAYDPYTPSTTAPQHIQPPSSLGLSSFDQHGSQSSDPYGPPIQRSSGYLYESNAPQNDQYAPHTAQAPYDPYGPGTQQYEADSNSHLRVTTPGNVNDFGTSPSPVNYFSNLNAGQADHTYTPQQVLEQKPLSEDPLGRSTLAARNKPLAIFGFGGVLLTSFPGVANVDNEHLGHARTASYGYASGRGQIWIRPVSEVVSESALRSSETPFPGPLVLDPTTSKSAANDKKKKDAVLDYLNSRADEIEKGLPYLKTSANATRREQEGKLALIRVLVAMVIGDGKLSGSPEVEEALRTALRSPSTPSPASTFSPTSVAGTTSNGFNTSLYQSGNQHASSASATPAQLAQLSSMLASGDKRDAALYAASQGLWAHALLASSGVDQEFWREIVTRFTAAELQSGAAAAAALKTSYTIFGGLGPTAIDDLVSAAHITDDPSADQWREVISSLLFNGKAADMGYFDEFGARLTSAGLVNAGHVCSILSPLSPFSDMTPAALERPITMCQNSRDEDVIIFAEIAEFARSLLVVPKGQELPFPGLPQLLPYKLSRAWWAAELGERELAERYCTAVESASKVGKNGPSLLSRSLLNSLEDLQERLTGEPSIKPANLFGGRKQSSKPGVNKLGSWIEGRLSKFIAGEEDDEGPIKAAPPVKGKGKGTESASAPVGPFSHFSTISPGPSNPVTRRTSTADVRNGQLGVDVDSRRTSPSIGHNKGTSSSASSMYGGEQYASSGFGGYQPYVPDDQAEGGDEDTPHALEPAGGDDDVELLNPMAGLSLGAANQTHNDYAPPSRRDEPEDDEDDLGFGNAALSRNRTPKPADGAADKAEAKKEEPAKAAAPAASAQAPGPDQPQRSGWLRGWFGKKEGEGSGPVRAKLGEESSMVYDNDLKRWVVKGAKPEAAAASTPPPPPRVQTASPSKTARDSQNARASSATPPPSQLSRSAGPGGAPPPPSSSLSRPSSGMAPLSFTETADGGIKRKKSSLAESTTPGDMSPAAPPAAGSGPPRPPSGPPKPPGASIDDLLSRPPSKRPASAARKGAKNRYVDVFQNPGAQ